MAVTIEIPGIGPIKLSDQNSWAKEETQLRIEKLLSKDDPQKPLKDAVDPKGQKPGSFGSGLKEQAKELLKSKDFQKRLSSEIQYATDSTIGLAKAIFGGERSFNTLNPIIGGISDAFAGLLEEIPFLGGVLGGTVAAISKVRQELNDILTGTVQKFDTLGQAGLESSESLLLLQAQAAKGRIGLDTLIGATTQASQGLISLEGNFTAGVKRFMDLQQGILTREDNLLEKLGLNVEDQAAFISEFIEANRNNALLNTMSQNELSDAVFESAKNMRILAEFTGVDIQAQKEAMMQQATDMAFQARLLELSRSGREDEANAIREFVGRLAAQDPSGVLTQRFKEQFSTFEGVVTEQSGVLEMLLQQSGIDVAAIAMDVKNGTIDVVDAVTKVLSGAEQALNADTTFAAQLSMIDGGANTLSTVAQGLIAALGRFSGQDVAANAERARDNVNNTGDVISEFNLGLVEGRQKIQESIAELESAILLGSQGLIQLAIDSNQKLAEGFGKIIEGAKVGDIGIIAQGLVQVVGESIVPGSSNIFSKENFKSLFSFDPNPSDPNSPTYNLFDGKVESNQLGGDLMPGDLSIVGEAGPELIKAGPGGNEIINNATSSNIMGAAGAVMDNVNGINTMGQQTLDVLTAISRDTAENKKLLQRILPKAVMADGYF